MLDKWIEGLLQGRRIETDAEVCELCRLAREVLSEEANLRAVSAPVAICGDIHGQFVDLLELFRVAGAPPATSFVFLGDYVDRGRDSVEVIQLLLCYKVRWPDHMTLLRGNHESRQITKVYGFYDECLEKYGSAHVWRDCCQVFDLLNVAALVENEVLCVHGGLSPAIATVGEIQLLRRDRELPNEGPYCDLLWSDPADDGDGWQVSNRGAGYLFGARVTAEFNALSGLSLVARAHQLVMEGFKHHFDDRSVVTVWSAPNYCGRCGNLATILKLDEHLNQNFVAFGCAEEDSVEFGTAGLDSDCSLFAPDAFDTSEDPLEGVLQLPQSHRAESQQPVTRVQASFGFGDGEDVDYDLPARDRDVADDETFSTSFFDAQPSGPFAAAAETPSNSSSLDLNLTREFSTSFFDQDDEPAFSTAFGQAPTSAEQLSTLFFDDDAATVNGDSP